MTRKGIGNDDVWANDVGHYSIERPGHFLSSRVELPDRRFLRLE